MDNLQKIETELFRGIELSEINVVFPRRVKPGKPFKISVSFPLNSSYYSILDPISLFQRSNEEWLSYIFNTFRIHLLESIQGFHNNKIEIPHPQDTPEYHDLRWSSYCVSFNLEVHISTILDKQPLRAKIDRELLERLASCPEGFNACLSRLYKDEKLLSKLVGSKVSLKNVRLLDFLAQYINNKELHKELKIYKLKQEKKFSSFFLNSSFIGKPFLFTDDLKVGYVLNKAKKFSGREYRTGVTLVWLDNKEFFNSSNEIRTKTLSTAVLKYAGEFFKFLDNYMINSFGVNTRMGNPLETVYEV